MGLFSITEFPGFAFVVWCYFGCDDYRFVVYDALGDLVLDGFDLKLVGWLGRVGFRRN